MAQTSLEGALAQIRAVVQRIDAQISSTDDIRRQKGVETHSAIMTAVREIYVAEGYAGLSLGKVAERCGVNKGNIAYYFPTKSELLRAMLLRELARYLSVNTEQVCDHAESPQTALKAVTDHYVKDARTNFPFFLQTWGYIASDSDARALYSEIYLVVANFLGALIRAANSNISEGKAKIAALEIMQTIDGYTVQLGMNLGNARIIKSLEKRALERIEQVKKDVEIL